MDRTTRTNTRRTATTDTPPTTSTKKIARAKTKAEVTSTNDGK